MNLELALLERMMRSVQENIPIWRDEAFENMKLLPLLVKAASRADNKRGILESQSRYMSCSKRDLIDEPEWQAADPWGREL